MGKAKTKLTAVAEKFRKLDKRFRDGSDLDIVASGYAKSLIHAISHKDKILKCEALKSLGDVYLQKAKTNDDKAENFNKACALYKELLRYYRSKDERETIKHRIKYAEKCTRLSHVQEYAKSGDANLANNTLAVAMTLYEVGKKSMMKGQNVKTLIEVYTKSFVQAVVGRNIHLKMESLKSLGDLYLEKGRVVRNEAAFTKAAGLYRAALDRCEDSDGRETLKHRIKYAEKVKEKAMKKRRPKTAQHGNRKAGDDITTHQTAFGAINQNNSKGTYKNHLQEGCRALQTGDLDTAEQHFAAALKSVHVKDSNEAQHRKEAEPLYKLSDVYLTRGMRSKDGAEFTKAAALCNAALVRARAEDTEGIKQTIQEINKSFVKHVLSQEQVVDTGDAEKHELMSKKHRDRVKAEMKRIERKSDPYSLDDDDPKLRKVEKRRAEEIKALCETIVNQRRTFIADLVDECIEVMGPLPCKYAMIGLGSQATGLVTPYSDLEFAILIEEETEDNVRYFRNLTHYLHLKVINLGETILPAMAIKSLNDFQSNDPLDNWFYDSVTPRGFSFDGAMPHACKTPLGRGKQAGLIHTPRNMAKLLEDDLLLYLKKGYHLASILGNVCLITGEQDLVDIYTTLLSRQRQDNDGLISLLVANITLDENEAMFKVKPLNSKLLDVKKQIYRFASLAVSCWALLRNIHPTTIWETIEKMHKNGVISSENAHHLMVLVSISAELRLRTYMNNRGQVENMSALSSTSAGADIGEQLKGVFHISNTKQLMRYYNTERPFKVFISQLADNLSFGEPLTLFSNSPKLQAEVYLSLCDFQSAQKCLNEVLEKLQLEHGKGTRHPNIAMALSNLGNAWIGAGEHRKALGYIEQSLKMMQNIYGKDTARSDIAVSLGNLGDVWMGLGDHRQAIRFHEQSLQMMRSIYGENTVRPDIAQALRSLGDAWYKLADHRKAVGYFEQSLQMQKNIYGENAVHPDISMSLSSLGHPLMSLGEYRKAVSYYEKSLQMDQVIYGGDTAHPVIASSSNNLALAWWKLGNHGKAINYHEQSLKIQQIIYGEDAVHPGIAETLLNMGLILNDVGDYKRADSYFEQSLRMQRVVYGERNAHPGIAASLCNLGSIQRKLGDHRKAITYFEQALQMQKRTYGENTPHPEVSASLTNLGQSWSDLGDYRKSIGYYEQSLQIDQRVYGKSTAHPDIATSLSKLGNAWADLGDLEKSVDYLEQSLQMRRKIYGESTAHPDIACTFNNLGLTWHELGNHRKAIIYHEQSLQMRRSIYGECNAHPDIAASLNNLGSSWISLGDHEKALGFHEQSLKMNRSLFGENNAHPSIAKSLSNLGYALMGLGNPGKALGLYEQSLAMERSVYGENTAHPEIAGSLQNVGTAWGALGNYNNAVMYFERSLQMYWSIYGKRTAHQHIADSLQNLGVAWRNLGDYVKADSYFERSLRMKRSIHS
uniref:Uncharacterized protein n=1 Tax=Branchiostoma floridae TaxID=7739 RepID=C3ZPX3_BRAFL|eukprot:XP_002589341.1 hypothetical protein BRAFLDRAFT_77793 [Branchiostoma floridae]